MVRARCSASSIVSPVTNCSPSICMASCTPWRISGSPLLPINRVSAASIAPSLFVANSLPVSSNPHDAAFTNSDELRPTCWRQSPWPILSRINALRVAASGMRSSASARHISATPSSLDSAYSCIRFCTRPSRPPCCCPSRIPVTSWRAIASVRAFWVELIRAAASIGARACASGKRVARAMDSRRALRSSKGPPGVKCAPWVDIS